VRNDLIRRDAVLNPLHERVQCVAFDGVRPGTTTAVRHPRQQEQPGEFLRATQTFLSLSTTATMLTTMTTADGVTRGPGAEGPELAQTRIRRGVCNPVATG
jgi:hypothetical protein